MSKFTYYPEDRSLRVPWSVQASFAPSAEPVVAVVEDAKYTSLFEHAPEMREFIEAFMHESSSQPRYELKSWAANLLRRTA